MAQIETRPDIDIEHDIHEIITHYPPLAHDRHRIHIQVESGRVKVSGYVKTPVTFRHFLNRLPQIAGVKAVNSGELYNDEAIRLHAAHHVPPGVQINVEYGAVILSGDLPQGASVDEMATQVGLVPGVHRVVTAFR